MERSLTIRPKERIYIVESKLHGMGKEVNDLKMGIIFLAKEMSEEYVRSVFEHNQQLP